MKTHQLHSLKVRLAIMIPTLIWGSSYLMIRIGLQETTPYPPGYSACSMALLRYLIASLAIIIPYSLISFKCHVRYQDYPRLLLNGTLGIGFYTVCINLGEEHVAASVASFIISMMPIFIMLLSIFFLGEKPILHHLGFVLLSLGGLGLIAWDSREEGSAIQGLLYLFVATFVGACFSILQKKSLQHYHPCQVIAFAIWGGTLAMIVFLPSLMQEMKKASHNATASVAYLGIFCSAVAFSIFAYALAHQSPSQISPYMYLTPIITTFLEWCVDKKAPNLLTLLGEGLALVGVILIQLDKKKT